MALKIKRKRDRAESVSSHSSEKSEKSEKSTKSKRGRPASYKYSKGNFAKLSKGALSFD